MSLQSVIEDKITGAPAGVNANNELQVALSSNEDDAGFAIMACKMGSESDPGGLYVERVRASDFGRLSVGMDSPLWNHSFPGSALNTGLWSSPTTTMTVTVTGGFLNLNAGAITTTSTAAQVRSYQHFAGWKTFALGVQMDVQFTQVPPLNNVCEWGWFLASGSAAPTDGVFFRLNAAGQFLCVVCTNGVESTSAALDFAELVGTSTTCQFYFTLGDAEVDFYVDDVHVCGVERPTAVGAVTSSMQLPMTFRNYNSGTAAAAQVMKVGYVNISNGDMQSTELSHHMLSGNGGHSAQGQTGATLGSTAIFINNSTPTAAVPTNTTAALATGLGGIFLETDTLAVNTDGIVMSYQVPVGTAALPGRTLFIHSIQIETFVSSALTGGGYVGFWGLTFGATAVSQATAEAATTKAPRRVGPFGVHAVASGAVASTVITSVPIQIKFETPIPCEQGSFVQLIRRKTGTAPSAGVLTHLITPIGVWK